MNLKGQSAPEIILEGIVAIVVAYIGLKIFEVLLPGGIGTILGFFLILLVVVMIVLSLQQHSSTVI